MSKGIVNANVVATVGDMKVSMKCLNSGASFIQMGLAASAITLATMTLYWTAKKNIEIFNQRI